MNSHIRGRVTAQEEPHESDLDLLQPTAPAYLDSLHYRAVHFFGATLQRPLAEAARYLDRLAKSGRPLYVLCVQGEFSAEDTGSDTAWQVKLVVSDSPE
jgi:hypothetical protein